MQRANICLPHITHLSCGNRVSALALLNDGGRLFDLLAEEVALDEVREPNFHLVAEELLGRDREDLVNFFKRLGMLASSPIIRRKELTSCLVSRTKQKIMNQAIKFKPA